MTFSIKRTDLLTTIDLDVAEINASIAGARFFVLTNQLKSIDFFFLLQSSDWAQVSE